MPSRGPQFRPRFTLLIAYFAGFFLLFGMLFALPDLLAAARALPASGEALTPEELDRAREVSQHALGGGRVRIALFAAIVTTGLAAWRKALPGLR